jgi:tetratricopeptide (TPR) repeat protein
MINDVEQQIGALKAAGFCAMLDDIYPHAVECYQALEKLCAEVGDTQKAGESAYTLGVCHLKLGQQDLAIGAFERSARNGGDIGDVDLEANAIMRQLELLTEKMESHESVDRGKLIALSVRLQAIPVDKISQHYVPPWVSG